MVSTKEKFSPITTKTELKLQLGYVFKQRQVAVFGGRDQPFVSALVLCMEKGVGFEKFHAL